MGIGKGVIKVLVREIKPGMLVTRKGGTIGMILRITWVHTNNHWNPATYAVVHFEGEDKAREVSPSTLKPWNVKQVVGKGL